MRSPVVTCSPEMSAVTASWKKMGHEGKKMSGQKRK